ncbi:MAG TPA: hypothetical protein VK718_03910 [Ferruginibacter sp.]|jgi:hypothetical protein|nr:hypothetical protein [Ferruginibacter sp.]
MSAGEEILKATKINIDKYGFFFWLIIFGFIEIIFSIIHAENYIPLGVLFCGFGSLGFALSEMMDRISYSSFKKENSDQAGTKVWVVNTPLWFHILNSVIKLGIFICLFISINHKYFFFYNYIKY